MHPKAALRRISHDASGRLRGVAVAAGVLPYRPTVWSDRRWNEAYDLGSLDYFGDVRELARYSVLTGYLGWLGGAPDVLDVGCGPGVLRRRLPAQLVGTYTGIDPTATVIEAARRAGLEDATHRFVVADTSHPDLGTFDVVICNEVLYMVPDPASLLADVHRLLRPGGHLLTSCWRHPGDVAIWRLVDRTFESIDEVDVRNRRNQHGPRGWRVACHRRT